jgi:hypothetical protein
MTNQVKTENPQKVITGPDTRWSCVNAWEAKEEAFICLNLL